MKLKHLLALIWVLAYSSESGKFKFFNFYTNKTAHPCRSLGVLVDDVCRESSGLFTWEIRAQV